jgi:hypothetical protein
METQTQSSFGVACQIISDPVNDAWYTGVDTYVRLAAVQALPLPRRSIEHVPETAKKIPK